MTRALPEGRPLRGEVRPPGDKSLSHRAAIFGALATGTSRIRGYSLAQDCGSTLACLESLGVRMQRTGDKLVVEGRGRSGLAEPAAVLDCGNSGTTFRLLLGALAGMDVYSVLTGDESLSRRPMDRVLQPLVRMGARADGRSGGRYPPIAIRGGRLAGIDFISPVASAQLKSAVLLAGLRADGETSVTEPAPSRDHTERMLAAMGADLQRDGLRVTVRASELSPLQVQIPADPSSAAFHVGAALILPGSELVVRGVNLNPGRIGFLRVMERMGGDIYIEDAHEESGEPVGNIRARSSVLSGVEIGGQEVPSLIDELPLLAVIATQAGGRTVIRDAAELRVKETDRIAVLVRALQSMGANIEERSDGVEIHGPRPLMAADLDAHGDHRIAMALAVAAMVAQGRSTLRDPECVAVSYPQYWADVDRLTAQS